MPFTAPNVKGRYDDVFTRETRGHSDHLHPGLKISKNTVNSPLKSWINIFTEPLLNKIVRYTNDYDQEKCSRWTYITVGDLKDLIAILFLAGIQKCKD